MDSSDLWTLYRSFLAVVQHGSLSRGAKDLGISQPTLGRHIAALEDRLGSGALFTRSVRGLTPTEAALAIRPHVETMNAAAAAIRRTLSAPSDALEGTVRISASDIVGTHVLPAILADLRNRHPGLVIELSLSNDTEDLIGRAVDIAVRMVRPTQKALLARRIGAARLGVYAHKSYADRHGLPATRRDFAQHALIGFDRETPYMRMMAAAVKLDRSMFTLRTDSDLAALGALTAGFGLGFCQVPLARRLGNLVPVLAGEIGFDLPIWIAMHEDLKTVRRMRTVFDHLASGMKAYLGA
ncbi:hypothetical protein sos41_00090 [Alphaproteobacteria bacterium SO-S41]|nr:hypothetical protein sos41_00090 [Alphaproteobacteria bacterium SO-S41]